MPSVIHKAFYKYCDHGRIDLNDDGIDEDYSKLFDRRNLRDSMKKLKQIVLQYPLRDGPKSVIYQFSFIFGYFAYTIEKF